jgi:hypothetical protein
MRKKSTFRIVISQWNLIFGALTMTLGLLVPVNSLCYAKGHTGTTRNSRENINWTEYFNQEGCNFYSIGRNEYFILEPKYRLVLSGKEREDSITLTVTVLDETKIIGNVDTRVVEEKEKINGIISEISRNYLAFCLQTASIFNFGEDVDVYRDGKIIGHDGSWRADSVNSRAGLLIPGTVLSGSKYYTEISPEIALDRVEIINNSEVVETPAGTFNNCLKIRESSPIEPNAKIYKIYAPGIGLVKNGNLLLTKEGYKKK